MSDDRIGIQSFVLETFQQLLLALDNGLIPIYDTKTHRLKCLDDGSDNPFYKYYKMPEPITTIDEVMALPNANRIMGAPIGGYIELFKDYYIDFHHADWLTEEIIGIVSPVYNKYFEVTDGINSLCNKWYNELFPQKGKIIGVNIRCAYVYCATKEREKYGSHANVLSVDQLEQIVRQRMEEWGYDYLFLICDDRVYLEEMKRRFGDKLIFVDRPKYHYYRENWELASDDEMRMEFEENPEANNTFQFMAETELLAKCDSLIFTISSASNMAVLRKGLNFEYIDVYDLGMI